MECENEAEKSYKWPDVLWFSTRALLKLEKIMILAFSLVEIETAKAHIFSLSTIFQTWYNFSPHFPVDLSLYVSSSRERASGWM